MNVLSFHISKSLLWAGAGTGFAFLMTLLGAATVLFLRKPMKENAQRVFLGFAAGVMIAAAVWSLLLPAIEESEKQGNVAWIAAAGGFALGGVFLFGMDTILPHLHPNTNKIEGTSSNWRRTTLLILAVTLHNIPEGMAVGLAFALASQQTINSGLFTAAFALAIGIGIQNFPEGAAVSLPLRKEGLSRGKAFLLGSASGIVEPIFGLLTVLVSRWIAPYMPWLLSFAAGAMIYVVVEELIPEANLGEHSHTGTAGAMAGFILMMILDVALG